MSDYIPHELLVDILVRLPVASLLRFKSVCKAWNSLITDPSFVTKHLNHSKTNSEKILLGVYTEGDDQRGYLLCRDNERFGDESSESKFPFVVPLDPPLEHFKIVGSLNGILCLQLYFFRETSIMLWNPSTRKSVIVPKHEGLCVSALGFGLHPATHEYKLVIIEYEVTHLGIGKKFVIYTQATGWRRMVSTLPYDLDVFEDAQAFVNGAINWIGSHQLESGSYCNLIVSFDMSAETLSLLTLPPTLANEEYELNIKVFQGSLSVLCHQLTDTSACYMWVMKEYGVPESWTNVFSFELDVPLLYHGASVFGKHRGVLLWIWACQLIFCRSRSKRLTEYFKRRVLPDLRIKVYSITRILLMSLGVDKHLVFEKPWHVTFLVILLLNQLLAFCSIVIILRLTKCIWRIHINK